MYNVHPFSLSPVLPFVDRMVIMNHIFKNSYFWIKIQYTSSVSVLSHPALFLFVRSPLRRAEPRALFQIRCIFSMPSVARPAAPPCMACLAPPPPCDFSPLALNLWPYPQPERRTDWNASKAKNRERTVFHCQPGFDSVRNGSPINQNPGHEDRAGVSGLWIGSHYSHMTHFCSSLIHSSPPVFPVETITFISSTRTTWKICLFTFTFFMFPCTPPFRKFIAALCWERGCDITSCVQGSSGPSSGSKENTTVL